MTAVSDSAFSGSSSRQSSPPSASECSPSASTSSASSSQRSEAAAIAILVRALHDHEQQLSLSLASGARLQLAAAEVQTLTSDRLGYLGGHQFFTPIIDAQAHSGQAMARVVEGHRKLVKIGEAIGYRLDEGDGNSGFGDYVKPPSSAQALMDAAAVHAPISAAS